jgi:hypothetical protein
MLRDREVELFYSNKGTDIAFPDHPQLPEVCSKALRKREKQGGRKACNGLPSGRPFGDFGGSTQVAVKVPGVEPHLRPWRHPHSYGPDCSDWPVPLG